MQSFEIGRRWRRHCRALKAQLLTVACGIGSCPRDALILPLFYQSWRGPWKEGDFGEIDCNDYIILLTDLSKTREHVRVPVC